MTESENTDTSGEAAQAGASPVPPHPPTHAQDAPTTPAAHPETSEACAPSAVTPADGAASPFPSSPSPAGTQPAEPQETPASPHGAPPSTMTNVSTGDAHAQAALARSRNSDVAREFKVHDRRGRNGYTPSQARESGPNPLRLREAHVGLWKIAGLLRTEIEEAESAQASHGKNPSPKLADFIASLKKALHDVLALHATTYTMNLPERLADVTDGMRQAYSLATKAGIKIPGPAPSAR